MVGVYDYVLTNKKHIICSLKAYKIDKSHVSFTVFTRIDYFLIKKGNKNLSIATLIEKIYHHVIYQTFKVPVDTNGTLNNTPIFKNNKNFKNETNKEILR